MFSINLQNYFRKKMIKYKYYSDTLELNSRVVNFTLNQISKMKTKISFTSVLKSKENRQLNFSSQYSTQSQNRHQKLIDIYEQFETYPEQDYTLDFNVRNMVYRSRNSSMNVAKSKKMNEDPEIDLESWIQIQKRQNYESFTKSHNPQKSFKQTLSIQRDLVPSRRSRSNLNKNQTHHEQDDYNDQVKYYQINNINKNQDYDQPYMEQSNHYSQKETKKSPINYHSQNQQFIHEKTLKAKQKMEQSSKINPHQYLASEQLKSKSYYPDLEEQEYDKLKQEFQKIKNEKITELCMQTKKSIKKDKLQQIISKTLQNIYEDIELMAEQMKTKKQNALEANKKISQQQVSQQMLISGSHTYDDENIISQSSQQEERRKEQMKTMIKGYISGIQEAKSHGRNSSPFQQGKSIENSSFNHQTGKYSIKNSEAAEESREPSFNQNSTFNNQINHQNTFNNQINKHKLQRTQKTKNQEAFKPLTAIDSVGYSFSNNIVCEHSFSRQLANNHNFPNNEHDFTYQKIAVKPPIYEPQNSDDQRQQKISLPNIEQVKSDFGDFPPDQYQVQTSDQLDFKRNKIQNLPLEIPANNIKNIESVHYQPPASQSKISGYFQFNTSYNSKAMFKHFEQTSQPINQKSLNKDSQKQIKTKSESIPSFYQQNKIERAKGRDSIITDKPQEIKNQMNEIGKEPNIYKQQKFVSKTFNSYLSGEMRSQYGQTIRENPVQTTSYFSNNRQSGLQYKISPIVKYSPPNQKAKDSQSLIKLNKFSESAQYPKDEKEKSNKVSTFKEQTLATTNLAPYDNYKQIKINKNSMSESPNFSLNQSLNHNSTRLQMILSPKNVHQLQSKSKFNISSPMAKIDEIISQQKILMNSSTQINQFQMPKQSENKKKQIQNSNKQQDYHIPSKNGSLLYAISSPVGQYKIGGNLQQKIAGQNNDKKYACSQSIVYHQKLESSFDRNNKTSSNSILSMKPLKMSSVNDMAAQQSFMCEQTEQKRINLMKEKVTESIQNRNVNIDIPKPNPSSYSIHQSPNFNNGKNFLQSLHQKQSIELSTPFSNDKQSVLQSKESFAAETFRPKIDNQNNTKQSIKIINTNEVTHFSTNKMPITKIVLRSSDRNQAHSPKVISLTLNTLAKNQSVKQFSINHPADGKQNIFQKLTIRDSKVEQTSPADPKLPVLNNIKNSIKNSPNFGISKIQIHTDVSSKENSNTLNNQMKVQEPKNEIFKMGISKNQETGKEIATVTSNLPTVERKEPLLKLSKNLTSSIRQIDTKLNVKKSIGQNIRSKVHLSSSVVGSRTISIGGRQSFKGGVKQSGGNDSDMDFDLQLD